MMLSKELRDLRTSNLRSNLMLLNHTQIFLGKKRWLISNILQKPTELRFNHLFNKINRVLKNIRFNTILTTTLLSSELVTLQEVECRTWKRRWTLLTESKKLIPVAKMRINQFTEKSPSLALKSILDPMVLLGQEVALLKALKTLQPRWSTMKLASSLRTRRFIPKMRRKRSDSIVWDFKLNSITFDIKFKD